MKRVLFICVHNSARSQMAEEYLRRLGGGAYEVESAGLEPGEINPLAARVMAEEGIDISAKRTQSVFDLWRQGKTFDLVVTVCEESAEKQCPVFPGPGYRLHLPFADPSSFTGTEEEKLEQTREVREAIRGKIEELIAWDRAGGKQRLGDLWNVLPVAGKERQGGQGA